MFAQDSIELLKDSGIDFARNEAKGIEVHRFGEVLMSSGIVLNEDVRSFSMMSLSSQSNTIMICILSTLPGHPFDAVVAMHQVQWVTFHSGYDFGYLLKVLTCQPLPPTEAEFFELLQVR